MAPKIKAQNFDDYYDLAIDIEDKADRLGFDLKTLQKFEQSINYYNQALNYMPESLDCLYNKSRLLLEISLNYKFPIDAIEYLKESIRNFNLVINLSRQSNGQKLIQFDSMFNLSQAYSNLSEYLLDLNDESSAIANYNISIEILVNLVNEQNHLLNSNSNLKINDENDDDNNYMQLTPYQVISNIKFLIENYLKLFELLDDVRLLDISQNFLNDAVNLNNLVDDDFKEVDSLMLLQAKIHLNQFESADKTLQTFEFANKVIEEYKVILNIRNSNNDVNKVEILCEISECFSSINKLLLLNGHISSSQSWNILNESCKFLNSALDLENSLKSIGNVDPNSISNQMKILIEMSVISLNRGSLKDFNNDIAMKNYPTLIKNSEVYLTRCIQLSQPIDKVNLSYKIEDSKIEAIKRLIRLRVGVMGLSIESQSHLFGLIKGSSNDKLKKAIEEEELIKVVNDDIWLIM